VLDIGAINDAAVRGEQEARDGFTTDVITNELDIP